MVDKDHAGSLAYPQKGSLDRFIYKIPILLWRLGFGPFLSHPSRGGRKMMVVTTRGRKSKLSRHTMVSNIAFNQKDYAISGWWRKADWVKNIHQDPIVTIQAGGKYYSARARRVIDPGEIRGVAQALFDSGGDSHFGDWLDSLGIEHDLDALLDKKDQIYFVGFDRSEEQGPSPLKADLLWIWVILLFLIAGIWIVN